jgi:hypothetical protein
VPQELSDLHVESCIRSLRGEAPKLCIEGCDIVRRDIPVSHKTGWAIVRVTWTGDVGHRDLAVRSPEYLVLGFAIQRSRSPDEIRDRQKSRLARVYRRFGTS